VACDRATQTSPTPTQDQSTYVLMVRREDCIKTVAHQCVQALPPQLVSEGFTQTPPTWTKEKSTQISQGPTCATRHRQPPPHLRQGHRDAHRDDDGGHHSDG